jgi:exodeoxyribonuclease V alpha subunit
MPKSEVLRGFVKRVIAQKDEWLCFKMTNDFFIEVTVVGSLNCRVCKDQEVKVFGKFDEHPTWGQQFKASHIELLSFKTSDAAKDFIKILFPSLSSKIVNKITAKYKEKSLEVLENDLDHIDLLTADHKNYIQQQLIQHKEQRKSLEFLFNLDLSPFLCASAVEEFGSSLIEKVKDDPFCLLSIEGFPFAEADKVARRFGVQKGSPKRIKAVIFHILDRVIPFRGHLFASMSDLFREIEILNSEIEPIPLTKEVIFKGLKQLRSANKIVVESRRLYSKKWFNFEDKSAQKLKEFSGKPQLKINIEKFIRDYSIRFNIKFSEEQEEAIRAAAEHKIFIITGYPGTGKTFVTKVIVDLFKKQNLSFTLLTPTGISAKNLNLVTGEPAGTIHRTLGYKGRHKPWVFNAEQKFATDVVIIDECSMVDQEIFYRLLDALSKEAILIFIGDVAQLPSVGPGNILRDLIDSECIKVVSFKQIFRQSEGSTIKINAKRINEGKMVDLKEKSHFYFIPEARHTQMQKLIVGLAEKFKERNIQVLSPKKASLIGTHSLNKALKEVLNPPIDEELGVKRQEVSLSRYLNFRIDDKIMVTRNDYEQEVFNGDCGKILSINAKNKEICFSVEGSNQNYVYTFAQAKKRLQHAFAITIHKSQGLEYDVIIFPFTLTFYNQLYRNLLYTAITRASKRVFIIGDEKALRKAINNNKIVQRNTFLSFRIKKHFLNEDFL